jgi:membrane-bound lytic murein transglycosylase D
MRLKPGPILIATGVFLISPALSSATRPLLSDKSLPLESRLEQLFPKPVEAIPIPEELGSEVPLLEPVPLALARTLELDALYHPRVQFYLDYFNGPGRQWFQTWLSRTGTYQEYIQTTLRENNLPESIFYLALIESGLNPYAMSRRGAGGMWQFMPYTARRYGLRVDFWVDERRDLDKSTQAAIGYLTELYRRFGSWPLALASYNAGEGKVARVVEKNGNDNYWELIELPGLKKETKDYLPKMIAACIIAESPAEYGFVKAEKQTFSYEKLTVKDAVDLGKVAEVAGVSYAEIEKMNPAILRGITPPGCEYALKIPVGMGEKLLAAYSGLKPEERVTYMRHVIKKGDTLGHIAQRYGVTVEELRQFNHLSRYAILRVGANLIVPISRGKASSIVSYTPVKSNQSGAAGAGKTQVQYRVRPGDSLWSIAKSAGVTVADLQRWNNVSSVIQVNQILVLDVNDGSGAKPAATAKAPPPKAPVAAKDPAPKSAVAGKDPVRMVYEVQPGDTIWGISQKYSVSPEEIMKWNNLKSAKAIKPGDKLVVIVTN